MGEPKPDADWYGQFRRHGDQRSFYIACGISAALHLSMVTIFSIVIYFPRQDIAYREFSIMPVSPHTAALPQPLSDVPDVPAGDALGGQLALRDPSGGNPFSGIQLPTLEFAELARLRVRQESFQTLSRYDDLFEKPEEDSWSRFSRSLSGLTRSLSDLRLSGDASLSLGHEEVALPKLRPAEGFEAIIVWSGEPKDRALLFAPPVDALWDAEAGDLDRPIEVVMQVNALGRVVNVNVSSLNVAAQALVDAVQMTALQYRFEPLALEDGGTQFATLRIQREREGRAP